MRAADRSPTMVALKARHQAYRIAAELQQPPIPIAKPIEPAIPLFWYPDYAPRDVRSERRKIIVAVLIWATVGVVYLVQWLVYFHH